MTIQNQIKRFLPLVVLTGIIALVAPAAAMEEQLADNLNGTIKDNYSGLLWIQNPSVIPAVAGQKIYAEAHDACADLVHAGLGPNVWRLPTINELKGIYDGRFKNPRINTAFFSSEGAAYWSSTPYLPGTKAWTLNFKTGYLGAYDRNNPDKPARQYVRCVARL